MKSDFASGKRFEYTPAPKNQKGGSYYDLDLIRSLLFAGYSWKQTKKIVGCANHSIQRARKEGKIRPLTLAEVDRARNLVGPPKLWRRKQRE